MERKGIRREQKVSCRLPKGTQKEPKGSQKGTKMSPRGFERTCCEKVQIFDVKKVAKTEIARSNLT